MVVHALLGFVALLRPLLLSATRRVQVFHEGEGAAAAPLCLLCSSCIGVSDVMCLLPGDCTGTTTATNRPFNAPRPAPPAAPHRTPLPSNPMTKWLATAPRSAAGAAASAPAGGVGAASAPPSLLHAPAAAVNAAGALPAAAAATTAPKPPSHAATMSGNQAPAATEGVRRTVCIECITLDE